MKENIIPKPYLIWLAVFSLFFTGCVSGSGNYGRLVWDDTVKTTFENFEVAPEYDYYYYGPVSFPKAVIGLAKEYQMDSKLWRPIDLTSKQLRTWIWGHANRKPGDINRYGSLIKGPSDEHIGVWYAIKDWQLRARLEIGVDNKIKASSPMGDSNGSRRTGLFGSYYTE